MKYVLRLLLVVLFTDASSSPVFAQWVPTNGPDAPYISAFAVSDTNLFVATNGSGVFLCNGDTGWTAVNTDLTNIYIRALANNDTCLFAGTNGDGVFRSTNNGSNWTAVNSGLADLSIYSLAAIDTNLFAGTLGGAFLSTDGGISYNELKTGLPDAPVWSFAVLDTNIFVGTEAYGVFVTSINDTGWTAINTGLMYPYIRALVVNGTNLFAATPGGVYRSTNKGTSWTATNTGLTNTNVSSLVLSGTNLFAGTQGGGICVSTNNGASWSAFNAGMTPAYLYYVYALAVTGTNLYAGNTGGEVWRRPLADVITSVDQPSNHQPSQFTLEQNFPNPFNPSTTISFNLPEKSFVSLKIFDSLGREVSVIASEELPLGTHDRTWHAKGLSSGIYFYRLQAGSFSETRKLILLK